MSSSWKTIKSQENLKKPTVTVVIPARNEEEFIPRCLESIRLLKYPQDMLEIIVVDNGSTDLTPTLSNDAGAEVLFCPDARIGEVRNTGALAGTGEIIAFIDGDCIANELWLEIVTSMLKDDRIGIVGGDYRPNPDGTWVERAWTSSRPGESRRATTLPGGCLAMRRDVFEEVGRFNERIFAGEDDKICVAIRHAEYFVMCIPECSVVHLGYPSSLIDVARRQYWHGSSQVEVAESWLDKQLILTHVFLISVAVVAPSTWTFGLAGLGLSVSIATIPIVLLAAKKARNRASKVRVFLQMCLIGLFFYGGRSVGLIRNYWYLLRHIERDNSQP